MAAPSIPPEVYVTKPMYNEALTALGKCQRCIEKLSFWDQMGFPQDDIKDGVMTWQPRLQGIVQAHVEQMGAASGRIT